MYKLKCAAVFFVMLAFLSVCASASTGKELPLSLDEGDYLSKDISKATILIVNESDFVYNGTAIKPKVTVTLSGVHLEEGRDYTVAYENNKNAGKASVVVTAKGDFYGTGVAYFEIAKAVPKLEPGKLYLESGATLGELHVPRATGVKGEALPGRLLWSPMPTFDFIIDEGMPLSGEEGETLELYWMFVPDKVVENYDTVSGCAAIIFGRKPPSEDDKLADELIHQTGDPNSSFSSGSSASSGQMSGETWIILENPVTGEHKFVTREEAERIKETSEKKKKKTVRQNKKITSDVYVPRASFSTGAPENIPYAGSAAEEMAEEEKPAVKAAPVISGTSTENLAAALEKALGRNRKISGAKLLLALSKFCMKTVTLAVRVSCAYVGIYV